MTQKTMTLWERIRVLVRGRKGDGLCLSVFLLVLLGSFLALTGMVLHILSRVMHEFKRELMAQGRQNKEAD